MQNVLSAGHNPAISSPFPTRSGKTAKASPVLTKRDREALNLCAELVCQPTEAALGEPSDSGFRH